MNQTDTRKALEHYLHKREKTHRVIALKGAWGTGKTHLWQKIAEEWPEDKPTPIYCSLFGKNSADEVRKALLDEMLTAISDKKHPEMSDWAGRAKNFAGEIRYKVIDVISPIFDNKNWKGSKATVLLAAEIFGRMADAILKKSIEGHLIVLDDFERRGRDLDVIATLGLVDYLKNRNCRVLFIFNEDRLQDDDAKAFSQFREKVIDVELKLETSSEEVYEIATEDRDIPYVEQTRDCFTKLDVKNIRVASRTINAIYNAYDKYRQLDELLLKNTLRAAVTLTAVYFNGVPNAPDFDKLVNIELGCIRVWDSTSSGENPEILNFSREFIGDVDDKFVGLLVRHLLTGAPLCDEFAGYWKQSSDDLKMFRLHQELHTWFDNVWWKPKMTPQKLAQDISDLLPKIENNLPILECQRVYDELIKIGAPGADQFISRKCGYILESGISEEEMEKIYTGVKFQNIKLHSCFQKCFQNAIEKHGSQLNPGLSLREIAEKCSRVSRLNSMDEEIINAKTQEDFEKMFRDADDLLSVGSFWYQLQNQNIPAVSRLAAAARKLLEDEPESRLGQIIRRIADAYPKFVQS